MNDSSCMETARNRYCISRNMCGCETRGAVKGNMKAIIFDMDGVIVDTEPYNLERLYQYVVSLNPQAQREELHQIAGRSKQDVWERIASVIGLGRGWEETMVDYRQNWVPNHPFEIPYRKLFREDTITILKWAHEHGMKTAVASSTVYEMVNKILNEVGVVSYLDLIISGEFFEYSKPDPAIYLKTAEMLEVLPEECVAIEDSTVGITAAHRAGMTVVALKDERFGFDRSLADVEIERLFDVIAYCEALV